MELNSSDTLNNVFVLITIIFSASTLMHAMINGPMQSKAMLNQTILSELLKADMAVLGKPSVEVLNLLHGKTVVVDKCSCSGKQSLIRAYLKHQRHCRWWSILYVVIFASLVALFFWTTWPVMAKFA